MTKQLNYKVLKTINSESIVAIVYAVIVKTSRDEYLFDSGAY